MNIGVLQVKAHRLDLTNRQCSKSIIAAVKADWMEINSRWTWRGWDAGRRGGWWARLLPALTQAAGTSGRVGCSGDPGHAYVSGGCTTQWAVCNRLSL